MGGGREQKEGPSEGQGWTGREAWEAACCIARLRRRGREARGGALAMRRSIKGQEAVACCKPEGTHAAAAVPRAMCRAESKQAARRQAGH